MKKIFVYPADMEGCGYFRLIWPANQVQKTYEHEVTIIPPNNREGSFSATLQGDTVIDVHIPGDPDVVVLQRVTHMHVAQCVRVMRKKGIVVIVDIDDNLSTIHPNHPAFVTLHPKKNPHNRNIAYHLNSWHNIEIACRDASLVTVSSDALLRKYARHGRGVVLRNYIPEGYLKIDRNPDDVFGWGGSVHSHPDDLQVMGQSVRRLEKEQKNFRIVGPVVGVKNALGLANDPEATGAMALDKWPQAIAKLRVGVTPLSDTAFNAAKSWLKPLEKAGVGVPCVMSPRAEYVRLHKITNGAIGLLAKSQQDWYRHIKRLMDDDVFCEEKSQESRQAAAMLTIERHASNWLQAWTETAV